MNYITNKIELKEYILRQLGSESHIVEISDANFNDIYNKALNYLYERSSDGVIRKVVIVDGITEKDIFLNNNVMSINKIVTTSNSYYDINQLNYISGISPVYDLFRGYDVQTSSYIILNEKIKEVNRLFQKATNYDFNSQTKRLVLQTSLKQFVMDYYESEDETLIYENELFLKFIERDCWKKWAINVGGKYLGATIGNGVELNTEFMMQMYKDLDDEIKSSVEEETYDFIAPRKI